MIQRSTFVYMLFLKFRSDLLFGRLCDGKAWQWQYGGWQFLSACGLHVASPYVF